MILGVMLPSLSVSVASALNALFLLCIGEGRVCGRGGAKAVPSTISSKGSKGSASLTTDIDREVGETDRESS